MSEKVFTRIKVGDSSSKVAEVLGSPSIFQPSAEYRNGTVLVYREKNIACGFTMLNDAVKEIACRSKESIHDPTSLLALVFE